MIVSMNMLRILLLDLVLILKYQRFQELKQEKHLLVLEVVKDLKEEQVIKQLQEQWLVLVVIMSVFNSVRRLRLKKQ